MRYKQYPVIAAPEYREVVRDMQARMQAWMEKTNDPMLPAFINRSDRNVVDKVILDTYGPPKDSQAKSQKRQKRQRNRQEK